MNKKSMTVSEAGRLGGARGTAAQKAAARRNGRLGGRPPKPTAEELRAQIAELEARKPRFGSKAHLNLAQLRDELADQEWKLKN